MKEENNKYVFYQYLQYFWRKKWYFLIVPVITTVLVVAGVYLLAKDKPFEGEAVFYTGSINSPQLENPKNIEVLFRKDIQKHINVFVSEKRQVKIKVTGDSEEEVKGLVGEIVRDYSKKLVDAANVRIGTTEKSIDMYKDRVIDLQKSIDFYNKQLESGNMVMAETYMNSLLISEQELSNITLKIKNMDNDVNLFEKPKVLSTSITKDKTYTKEAIAIGIILGLLLTVALLMLMKYIGDARRYFKE